MIKAWFFWLNIDKTVKQFYSEYEASQAAKVNGHTKTLIQPIDILSVRFHTVHLDTVSPLPPIEEQQ